MNIDSWHRSGNTRYAGDGRDEMVWLKGCGTCGGDLYGSSDVYGPYVGCVQCGRYLTAHEEARLGVLGSGLSDLEATAQPVQQAAA